MEPVPAPHESPAKGADKEVRPGSLERFKRLASCLFAVEQAEFQDALKKDEGGRCARCGR